MQVDFETVKSWWEMVHEDVIKPYYAHNFPGQYKGPETAEIRMGKKYAKIIHNGGVWCFIDTNTGLVYKSASAAAPAKHARGNIFGNNPTENMGPYGPAYLR